MCCGQNHVSPSPLEGFWTARAMRQHDKRVADTAIRKHVAGQQQPTTTTTIRHETPTEFAQKCLIGVGAIWFVGGGALALLHLLVVFLIVTGCLAIPVLALGGWVIARRLRESRGDFMLNAADLERVLAAHRATRIEPGAGQPAISRTARQIGTSRPSIPWDFAPRGRER